MTDTAVGLLRELASLLRRYRPEDFEELAQLLGRPEFAQSLSRVLAEIGAVGKVHSQSATRRQATSELLDRVRVEDHAKYELLKNAREILLDTKAHKSIKQLVEGVEVAGVHLKVRSMKSREDVVRAFLHSASGMPTADLELVVQRLSSSSRSSSDLQDWSRIIAPKKHGPV